MAFLPIRISRNIRHAHPLMVKYAGFITRVATGFRHFSDSNDHSVNFLFGVKELVATDTPHVIQHKHGYYYVFSYALVLDEMLL